MTEQTPMQQVAQRDDPAANEWFSAARTVVEQNEAAIRDYQASHEQPRSASAARKQHRELDAQLTDLPPLPLASWKPPKYVRREVMGQYLYDRDADVVHDVTAAHPTCQLDRITNATFVHFACELPDALPASARPCDRCMAD